MRRREGKIIFCACAKRSYFACFLIQIFVRINIFVRIGKKVKGAASLCQLSDFGGGNLVPACLNHLGYGQFAGSRMSTEDDFRMAEWRGKFSSVNQDISKMYLRVSLLLLYLMQSFHFE